MNKHDSSSIAKHRVPKSGILKEGVWFKEPFERWQLDWPEGYGLGESKQEETITGSSSNFCY